MLDDVMAIITFAGGPSIIVFVIAYWSSPKKQATKASASDIEKFEQGVASSVPKGNHSSVERSNVATET